MGAWGVDPFDNDDAADWAAEFEEVDGAVGLQLVELAFTAVGRDDYIDAREGSIAVAAAQIVGWLLNPDEIAGSSYSAYVVGWVQRTGARPARTLVEAARRSLQRVLLRDSELAAVWGEAGDDAWQAALQRIDRVLSYQ